MTAARRAQVAETSARAIGIVVALAGMVVLAASVLDVISLTSIVSGWPRMVPATAAAFVLSGLSLAALASTASAGGSTGGTPWRELARAGAAATLLLSGGRLAEYGLGRESVIESLGLAPTIAGRAASRMAPATALTFLLVGTALLLTSTGRKPRLAQALSIAALLIGWLGLSGYVYGGAPLRPYADMAFHTALLLMILSAGALGVTGQVGIVALLTRDTAGGTSARRLLAAAVLLPLAAAWLPLYAQRVGWVTSEAGLSLFALSTALGFGALVWINAARLDQSDRAREAAQAALRQSDERTRLILESALDAVITIHSTGVIAEWSGQAEAVFGWTRKEVLGRSLAEIIIPPRYREAHRSGLRRYLKTGEERVLNRRIELSALHRKGHEFPVELAIVPLRTGDGVAFSAFVRDITERVQAETALRESEGRLRTLAESLPHLVWTCRPDGWCDYVSRQWQEYTGLDEEVQLGYGWAMQLHPDDRDRVRAEWAAATAQGDHFDTEFRIRRADGAYRWFKTRAVPLRDSKGSLVKWFGSNTDCEDYKQSEARLRAQLERLSLLDQTTRAISERQDLRSIFQVVVQRLENELPIDFGCVCLYDPAGHAFRVSCVGERSAELVPRLQLGEQGEIAIDSNGLSRCLRGQLVYEPDLARSTFPLPQQLAQAGLGSLVVAPLIVESVAFGAVVAARRAPGAFSSGDCEFLRQLSDHVALAVHQAQLYGALQRAYEDLRQTQQTVMQQERLRALGQMASGVAHDINNALSPAALYTQALLEQGPAVASDAREQLSIIQRAIEDVARTVARLRDFARQQEQPQTPSLIDLNRTITQVLELTRARWSDMPLEHGRVIQVSTELTADLAPISGAENEIRDALTNLVLNAVDAMPEGGTLTLRSGAVAAQAGKGAKTPWVQVEVADTGVGMDEATRRRCLEPFFTTKGERGTGLGLAMVFGMVQRHGATVEVESEPGKGSTIRLIFPAARETTPEPGPPVTSRSPASGLRILLIDDDPMLLTPLRAVLELEGHTVVAADGGEAGIAAFCSAHERGEPFTVVITDLGMPRVDGRKVAAAIKGSSPAVPIILLTGWGHGLATDEAPALVDRVLSKPPVLAELRAALADLAPGRGP